MNNTLRILFLFGFISLMCQSPSPEEQPTINNDSEAILSLTRAQASHLAQLAKNCIQIEYPNKLSHVMDNAADVRAPRELHPAFYGCFDWHSSVHGHWMLVRLLKLFPDLPEATEIRRRLDENLQEDHIIQEVLYLRSHPSFERTYGWAWLLQLALELESWPDPQARSWALNLRPLTEAVVKRYLDFLPRLTYPIRSGEHPNSAFGMAYAWDYAVFSGNEELQQLIEQAGRTYFLQDQECPASWEPNGFDFLSPCLEEANLMRRILPQDEFQRWLDQFLPGFREGQPASLFQPPNVSDRTDPKLVHLDGLNLSRAWCMLGIASALQPNDPGRKVLQESAYEHIAASLPHIASGNYEGEHWLASFAVYALSQEH